MAKSLKILWPLYCLSFDLQFVIIPIVSSSFWPLYCLSFDLQFVIIPIVSSNLQFEDTIGIITNCKSKDRQCNGQKFEDTIGIITNCKSKDRQYNGQKLPLIYSL
jgi:hypothetical protein